MRTLVIGDIHGCLRALDGILDAVQPRPGDRIITLGDYVDRGPDSRTVIDRVLGLAGRHELIPLLGNHEEMMLDAREDPAAYHYWRLVGGDKTVASYIGPGKPVDMSWVWAVPDEHWRFIGETCRDWHETDTHIFVHGGLDPTAPMVAQDPSIVRWAKFREPLPHQSGKVMVCGHTAQSSGRPINIGHAVCIDTCVYGGGWLSCLHVETGRLWQASQRGELRLANVRDFLTV